MNGYFRECQDGRIECLLCPHHCTIAEGRYGRCRVRRNRAGKLDLPFYGKASALALDPIEKKPLYHFYPASSIFSVGFLGCSFTCPFCQNYSISQQSREYIKELTPTQLVDLAVAENSFGIAYTYSEPLIHYEFVLESARLAKERGLKNVLVSNGFIEQEPAREMIEVIDAANIDLKCFNSEFYAHEIGGNLNEVKRFISQAASKMHLEITTLVIPGKNDTEAEIEEIATFIAGLDPGIPYHLSCYFPAFKYDIRPTKVETVQHLAQIAGKHLSYVYLGNVGYRNCDTVCPSCGNLLIRREGYSTRIVGLKGESCLQCGYSIPIPGV